jgi:protein involved in polysaccharide export with SLBB domain
VVRGGRVAYRFDVYEYLVNPQNNVFLEDGDFVVVKPVKKRVVLNGGVLRAGRVELLDKEGIADALKYAGGFSTRADASRITLSRLNGINRSLYTLDYTNTEAAKLPALLDGDELFVFQQGEDIQNRVKVEGEVYFPGSFALSEGLGLKQLLAQAGGFTPEANQDLAFVIRTLSDGGVAYLRLPLSGAEMENFKLQNKDQLVVFSQSRFQDAFEVEVRGEVRNPVRLAYRKGLNLGVLLDYAGGLKYSADLTEVEILRSSVFTDGFKSGDRNQTVRIKVDLASQGNFKDIALLQEDIVLVRKVSNLDDRIGVSISGEVIHPGVFVLGKNENRVRDLIAFSGGLTVFADANAAQLFRGNGEQLVFDLDAVVRSKNSEYNYRLMDGDRLVVPQVQDLVVLPNTDTLLNKRNILAPYIAGKRAGYYLRNYSLGFDKEHRKSLLYLQEPGGKIRRSKHYGLFIITPKVKAGSKIYFQPVAEKKEKVAEAPREKTDWNRVIEGFTVKLTGIATLWILLTNLNK